MIILEPNLGHHCLLSTALHLDIERWSPTGSLSKSSIVLLLASERRLGSVWNYIFLNLNSFDRSRLGHLPVKNAESYFLLLNADILTLSSHSDHV